ncbi:MAG: aminotransferase class IV [Egibacteraceae bacterium]
MGRIADQPGKAVLDGRIVPLDQAFLAITDDGAARGDGVFETIGVWGGRAFRVADHLRRLAASSLALRLPAPDAEGIATDIGTLLAGAGQADGLLRIYVTGSGARVVTLSDPPIRPPIRHLVPQPAPWIRPLGAYGPAGAKTMSYAHNMVAARAARAAGGDDALLVATEGWVLEGPTFAVLWVAGGIVRMPAIDLGIVDSITLRTLRESAPWPVEQGRWTVDDLAGASELMICSAGRDVEAVHRVGDLRLGGSTPIRDKLSDSLRAARLGAYPCGG